MGRASECGSDGRRFETCQTPQMVGSSNRSGLQIFNLSTRVRSSYRLQIASIAQRQCSSLVMSRSQVRILLEAPADSLAQLDKSTTLRMSMSGVRVSHESHWEYLDMVFNGSMRTLGVCGVSSSLAIQTKGFSSNISARGKAFVIRSSE